MRHETPNHTDAFALLACAALILAYAVVGLLQACDAGPFDVSGEMSP